MKRMKLRVYMGHDCCQEDYLAMEKVTNQADAESDLAKLKAWADSHLLQYVITKVSEEPLIVLDQRPRV